MDGSGSGSRSPESGRVSWRGLLRSSLSHIDPTTTTTTPTISGERRHWLEEALEKIIGFPDLMVLLAALIRNNKPGVAVFRLANGNAGLKDALSSDSTRFQRKALNLTLYLLTESNSDCGVVSKPGFPRMMIHLASSPDSGMREAALGGLLELAWDSTLLTPSEGTGLRNILQRRIESIRVVSTEDLHAAQEERHLVDSLWLTCYNELSLLHEEGFGVLPGEDLFQLPPDVATRFVESPLNVSVTPSNSHGGSSSMGDTSSQDNKKLLLLAGDAMDISRAETNFLEEN